VGLDAEVGGELVGAGAMGGETDPVPQAMVLTGIVVAVSATAVALALVPRRDDRGDPS
jgi:multicomponent Na+:H+ antiporter subunit C